MKIILLLAASLIMSDALAWDDCKFEKEVVRTLDLTSANLLEINARAGSLRVTGDADANEAVIDAVICASEEEWADDIWLITDSGSTAEITVDDPREQNSSWSRNEQFSMDLDIRVPAGISLDISDSSGSLLVRGSGEISIKDSSGDIEVYDAAGSVSVQDSSGDIEIERVEGDVVIEGDSSGGISGSDIQGSVLVRQDSSGDIRFDDVRDDFIVERDSSGNIVADTIGGDFRVLKDGSGTIISRDVSGEIDIPDKG